MRVAETRVEPVPNCEYAPISELRLITCNYGTLYKVASIQVVVVLNDVHTQTGNREVNIMSTVQSEHLFTRLHLWSYARNNYTSSTIMLS